jgi:DNA repair protein RadD
LANGETELVANCMVLTEGWDMPAVGCCILARPTRKMGLYRQMIGRVLRPADRKPDAIVLDHSGAVFRHGFVEDFVEWTLDPEGRAISPVHEQREAKGEASRLLECTQCGSIRVAGEPCGHCGFLPKPPPRDVHFHDGVLGLVDGKTRIDPRLDPAERARWHAELAAIAQLRGYQRGWIAHKFRERFGDWPRTNFVTPIAPSPEVLSWVRSRNIAWAKARQKVASA